MILISGNVKRLSKKQCYSHRQESAPGYFNDPTSPGKVASDGVGNNGIYTKYLLTHMMTPGISIEETFKRVRAGVMQETQNQQLPWESSSLIGNFYFIPGDKPSLDLQPPTVTPVTIEKPVAPPTTPLPSDKPWYNAGIPGPPSPPCSVSLQFLVMAEVTVAAVVREEVAVVAVFEKRQWIPSSFLNCYHSNVMISESLYSPAIIR